MAEAFKYKAFISYSHKDEKWARWLHRRLEQYTFPEKTIGTVTDAGPVPKTLKPIFRDRDELTAGSSLGGVIEGALDSSECLIVICSPNAVRSHWVSQEILYFKRRHGEARIFTVIVDGEPYASNLPHRQEDECLPAPLRFLLGPDGELSDEPAEPLAADLRPEGDGKRFGTLKLVSGMVGLGLDDLVQRDLQRARRRVIGITSLASVVVIAMTSLTWLAVDARGKAEQGRADAEGLIEFMLTDLKEKLEPVGRLDALQGVGEKAAEYYGQYEAGELDTDALGRQSRLFHYLGEIQDKTGNAESAREYFQRAYNVTQSLLKKDPKNPERVFEHAQSAYWVGYPLWQSGYYREALPHFQEYLALANQLRQIEPDTARSLQEVSYGHEMVGIMHYFLGDIDTSKINIEQAILGYSANADINQSNVRYQRDLANGLAWIANIYRELYDHERSLKSRERSCELYEGLLEKYPDHQLVTHELFNCENKMMVYSLFFGELETARSYHQEVRSKLDQLLERDDTNAENLIYRVYNLLHHAQLDLLDGELQNVEGTIHQAEAILGGDTLSNYDSNFVSHFLKREKVVTELNFNIARRDELSLKANLAEFEDLVASFGDKSEFDKEEYRSSLLYELYSTMIVDEYDQTIQLAELLNQVPANVLTPELRRDANALLDKAKLSPIEWNGMRIDEQLSTRGSLFINSMNRRKKYN